MSDGANPVFVLGPPRSGTSFVTQWIGRACDHVWCEAYQYPLSLAQKWEFPAGRNVLKWCDLWRVAGLLARKFPDSVFVQVDREPLHVWNSMVSPRPDSYPFRDFSRDLGPGQIGVMNAINWWNDYVTNTARMRAGIDPARWLCVSYERLANERERLSSFLGLELQPLLGFQSRNKTKVSLAMNDGLPAIVESGDEIVTRPRGLIKCKVCGGITEVAPVHDAWHETGYYFWRCLDCGSDSNDLTYDPGWYSAGEQATRNDWALALLELNTNIAILQRFGAVDGMTSLDYGTGDGAFVARLAGIGCDAHGYDVSKVGLSIIQERLSLPDGKLFLSPDDIGDRKFDIVTNREVVEHVDDPCGFLERLVRYVKPGGLFQVQTPQPGTTHHPLPYQSFHMVLIAPAKLAEIIEALGFEILDHLTWDMGQCITARRKS